MVELMQDKHRTMEEEERRSINSDIFSEINKKLELSESMCHLSNQLRPPLPSVELVCHLACVTLASKARALGLATRYQEERLEKHLVVAERLSTLARRSRQRFLTVLARAMLVGVAYSYGC